MKVMRPVTRPRKTGLPRPVSSPSSESPSEKAMEMPAPTAEAAPMRKRVRELCVAKAVAKMGARGETEPSIRPARPGCTMRRTKLLSSPIIWLSAVRLGRFSDIRASVDRYSKNDDSALRLVGSSERSAFRFSYWPRRAGPERLLPGRLEERLLLPGPRPPEVRPPEKPPPPLRLRKPFLLPP